MNVNSKLVEAASEWHGRITELQALISQLEAEVVEAEAGLAEEITALNTFEFKLRVGLGRLMNRLDELADWAYQNLEAAYHEPRLDHNDYRFHSAMPQPPEAALDEDQTAEIKHLYRQLARRFHPDMGAAADRPYRTQLMMAINAAYAAGDLERLKELALEPDLTGLDAVANDEEQLVGSLLRELARLQRRLAEIKDETASIQAKKNYRLMQQAQRAEVKGQDWLAEMKSKMQDEVARKLVERDVLKQELEVQEMISAEESEGLQGEAFADAIWDISLEATFDLDPDLEAEDWLYRHKLDAYRSDAWDEEDS
jgi:hypothetical protein